MYDECKRSNEIIVCPTLQSILWSIVQVCSLTIEYQTVHYVPSISISGQFESILLTILPRISIILLWSDTRQCKELILCRVVESLCSPTHNIVPHISWHDLPCHMTMKRYEDFEGMVISLLLPRKFAIRTWFCNCPQYLCLFHTVFEWAQENVIKERCWFSKSTSLCRTFHIGSMCFVSFQSIWNHPHTQIRIILFHDEQRDIPNWKPSPNRISNKIFSNCLSHNSPAKGWPYRFRSRGTNGSSILDHDLGHLCRGRRIQMSGHSDFGIFNNLWASSYFHWV